MSRKGMFEYAQNVTGRSACYTFLPHVLHTHPGTLSRYHPPRRLYEDKGLSKMLRTVGVAGTPAFIKYMVPRLRHAGMSVEAVSVCPPQRLLVATHPCTTPTHARTRPRVHHVCTYLHAHTYGHTYTPHAGVPSQPLIAGGEDFWAR